MIDLVAKLFDLSSYEAAQKLAQDLGLARTSRLWQLPCPNRSVPC